MKKTVIFLCLVILATAMYFYFTNKSSETNVLKSTDKVTQWELKPSLKYDMLCFINALVGDEYYLQYYQEDYNKFHTKFTPEVTSALRELNTQRQKYNIILGAWLSNLYSATDDETIDDMIATLNNDSEIWNNIEYSEDDKHAFETYGIKNLKIIFNFLKENKFDSYWKENILPRINERIEEIKDQGLTKYNIIPEVEKYTGFKLSSNKITVYLLYFAQPHGIRIQGTNLITDISYDFDTVVANAIHEMLHPPFQRDNTEFIHARDKLKDDEFIQEKIASQDKSHGYNSYEAYFEENCVDALEVLIREKFNILGVDAKDYFIDHDSGIDGLGVALYHLIKEDYSTKGESFQKFFIREVNTGKLASGKVRKLYNDFYAN